MSGPRRTWRGISRCRGFGVIVFPNCSFDAVQASAQVAASEFVLAQEKLAEAQKAVDIARAQTDAAVAQVSKSKAIVRQSEVLRQQIEERGAHNTSPLQQHRARRIRPNSISQSFD